MGVLESELKTSFAILFVLHFVTAVPLWPGKTLCKRWKNLEEKSTNGPSTSTLTTLSDITVFIKLESFSRWPVKADLCTDVTLKALTL